MSRVGCATSHYSTGIRRSKAWWTCCAHRPPSWEANASGQKITCPPLMTSAAPSWHICHMYCSRLALSWMLPPRCAWCCHLTELLPATFVFLQAGVAQESHTYERALGLFVVWQVMSYKTCICQQIISLSKPVLSLSRARPQAYQHDESCQSLQLWCITDQTKPSVLNTRNCAVVTVLLILSQIPRLCTGCRWVAGN